ERSSPGTGGGRRRSSRSRSPIVHPAPESDMRDDTERDEEYWTESNLEQVINGARYIEDALIAIRVALSILTSTLLPKRLYSSDYLSSMIATMRLSTTSLLFPILEATSTSHLSTLSTLIPTHLNAVCESLSSVIPQFSRLIQAEELSEDLVISTIYFSLEPFFHEASSSGGTTGSGRGKKVEVGGVVGAAMKGIRGECLGLVRNLLGRYSEKRGDVVEEVMNHLTGLEIAKKGAKGSFRLRNGTAIHTVSALIFHLVQTCPVDLASQIQRRLVDRSRDVRMKESGEEGGEEEMEQDEEEEEVDASSPLDKAASELLEPALDDVSKSARTIIGYLFQKSCKSGKSASGSTESEYKTVFDNLIADILSTLHLPEWPGAELLLTVCSKSMMAHLADPKTSHEANALKGLSLDHLGTIGARLRHDINLSTSDGSLKTLLEILMESDLPALNLVIKAHEEVTEHLEKSEQTSGEGASQYTRANFGRDLIHAQREALKALDELSNAELSSEKGTRLQAVADRLSVAAHSLWSTTVADDVFGPNLEDEQPRIDLLTLQLSRSQPLAGLYKPLLERVLAASESTVVAFRTKSLRGISLIVAQDPGLFLQDDVSNTIRNRIVDQSSAVRDTAIELVGKYVVGRPALAVKYLPVISERINDTGLNVRRRVVKLLRVLYSVVDEDEHQVEICRKLVWRALDDDEGVKELAADAIEDLWFSAPLSSRRSQSLGSSAETSIVRLSQIIMSVTGVFSDRDRPPPVQEMLRQIVSKHTIKNTKAPLARLQDVMETLIDGLLEQDTSISIVECVKTIYVLNAADPSLLSPQKTALLLPFLKSAATPDEHTVCDYLLKIFRSTVTALPKGSSQFSRDLQQALTPMINKPSSNLAYQQEVMACYCAVIRGQTHDFTRMISIYKACLSRLLTLTKVIEQKAPAPAECKAIAMLVYLTTLFAEFAQFDDLRKIYPATQQELDNITAASIHEHLFNSLVRIYNMPNAGSIQAPILTGLGYLYRGFPSLMLKPGSTRILDAIFKSGDDKGIFQVLRIIQDFLASQDRAPMVAISGKVKVETGVKIEELVGNVEGFADSGVGSAIAQRYIGDFFTAAMATNSRIQRMAVDIICSIARSGFSHPLGIAPVLVALSATSDANLADKAFATLTLLHSKYATLLASRFFASAQMSHDYASRSAGINEVRGYHGSAYISHFGRWYSLLQKEKRQHQMDYLKAITRNTFDLEDGAKCSEEDVSFARYIAEALSSLEYKRQEEPMSVIHYLNSALAVSGLQVVHNLEDGLDGGGGLMASITPTGSPQKASEAALPDATGSQSSKAPTPDLARQSIICGLALLLRDHLKSLYSITDVKLAKYQIGKKSAPGDKPVVRRPDAAIALGLDGYERLPHAISPMVTDAHFIEQRQTYCQLISEDGTVGAQEELDPDDDDF
ncbi:cohesin loading factor subunit SCC2, partial [Phenoliferia sp. Uapishka_3]